MNKLIFPIKRMKQIAITLLFTLIFTTAGPSFKIFANTVTDKEQEISMNDVSPEREAFLQRYMNYNTEDRIPVFDVERAKADKADSKLIEDAIEYNSSVEEVRDEASTYAGRTYFRKVTNSKYEVGLSSSHCKLIINGMKWGGKWVIKTLLSLIPGIGWLAEKVGGWLINAGTKVLKKYTSTGILITVQKNIFTSGWDISHRRQ